MSNNVTQPEEIDMVMKEFCDFFAQNEIENPQPRKSKSSEAVSDDEYYIPLYKASYFN